MAAAANYQRILGTLEEQLYRDNPKLESISFDKLNWEYTKENTYLLSIHAKIGEQPTCFKYAYNVKDKTVLLHAIEKTNLLASSSIFLPGAEPELGPAL